MPKLSAAIPPGIPPAIPPGIPRAALVTGGAQRIGRAIALALAEAGFDVAVHCHSSRADCAATCADITRLGRRATLLQADLAEEAQTATLLPQAVAALGPIGVLVNNASRFERDEWHDATRASWDAHLEPNLRAPFVLMQQFARLLPDSAQGAVINMLDQRVWSLTPHFVSYTVSKAALVGADPEHGAGAGAAHPGERHRPGPLAAQRTPDPGTIRAPGRVGAAAATALARRRSAAPSWPSWPCRR